jgi:hypothetical protein
VLGDRKSMVAGGLAVPSGDSGKSVGDVLDLDIHGGRINQIKASATQHSLPRAHAFCFPLFCFRTLSARKSHVKHKPIQGFARSKGFSSLLVGVYRIPEEGIRLVLLAGAIMFRNLKGLNRGRQR